MNLLPVSVRDYLHQIYKRTECKEHQLLYLFLEITRNCNLTCKHCGSDCSSSKEFNALTTDSWVKIIEDIASSFTPKPAIVLTGGEPLLHPEFKRIIDKLCELNFRWGIVTNGYELDDGTLKTMLSYDIHSITISLDGKEKNHNWLRGKHDSYSKAIQTIYAISKSKIPQRDVVTCVNPRNIYELDDISQVLIENGVCAWRLFRIFPAGRAIRNKELHLSIQETRKMIDWINEKKDSLKKNGLNLSLSCEGWLPFATDVKVRNQPFFCRAGINIASILCDGTITGCSNNSEQFFEGNMLNDNLAYKWKNGFQSFRNRKWVQTSDCRKCADLKKCQGSSIHLWRDGFKKPEFCYMDCYKDIENL